MSVLDHTFAALADPTRRAILTRLARSDATVGELAEPFAMSLPAVSRHLKVLEAAALISNVREGKHRRCHLNRDTLAEATDWLDFHRQFWAGSFERLGAHLKTQVEENKP